MNESLVDIVLSGEIPNYGINVLNCPVTFARDIFEYTESKEYMGFTLLPKQKFILEEFYKKDILTKELLYNVLILIAGMRGGKSAIGAFIGTYEAHKLLELDNPQEYWGILPGDEIYIVNTANSQDQSSETMFAKMKGFIEEVDWWKKYISWLKDREKKEKTLYSGDMFAKGATYINFKGKKIHIKAEHSNSTSLSGKTIKAYLSDELCRADTADEEVQSKTQKRSAQAIYNTLQKGTQTFGMEGKTVVASAPWFEDDYGMQLLYGCGTTHLGMEKRGIVQSLIEMSKKPKIDTYVGFHYTSKEMNPQLKDRTLMAARQRSPKTYSRDYEAIPPKTASQFFEDESIIDSSIVVKEEIIKFKDIEIVDQVKNEQRVFIGKQILAVKPDKLTKRIVCCDQGESNCAFVIGMAHGEFREVNYMGSVMNRLATVIDLILPYYPKEGKRVSFKNVEDVIKDLNKYYSVEKVTYDRWQSTSSLQELFHHGIQTELLGATFSMYEDFYNDLFIGIVDIPNNKDVIDSLKKLSEVKGKIVGSKDIADVVVRLNYLIRKEENFNIEGKYFMEPRGASFIRPSKSTVSDGIVNTPDVIWNKQGNANKLWTPFGVGG